MAKMANPGEDHRHIVLVRSGNHFRVPHRTARLDGSRRASFRGGDQSVGEREKGVAAYDAALKGQPSLTGFPNSDSAGVYATHLPGADAERSIRRGINNSIGFHMFDHSPAE